MRDLVDPASRKAKGNTNRKTERKHKHEHMHAHDFGAWKMRNFGTESKIDYGDGD